MIAMAMILANAKKTAMTKHHQGYFTGTDFA
jgi:hypothetical protein